MQHTASSPDSFPVDLSVVVDGFVVVVVVIPAVVTIEVVVAIAVVAIVVVSTIIAEDIGTAGEAIKTYICIHKKMIQTLIVDSNFTLQFIFFK